LAKGIFAIGVIGLGFLAIPALAGSSAYALSEALNWKEGLSRRFGDARGFYGMITISTIVGLAPNFVGIDPITALVFTAVFNGIAAVPLLYLIASRLALDRRERARLRSSDQRGAAGRAPMRSPG